MQRRDFLRRAAFLLPVMHAAGLGPAAYGGDASGATQTSRRPVQFLHLRLRTSRLDEQRQFYAKTLGLPVAAETGTSVSFRAGTTTLEFVYDAGLKDPFYHFAFNIPENKLDAAIEWMKPRAELVKRPTGTPIFYFSHWNAHAVYFFDPAGNVVEFIARHTLANAAGGAFDVPDILYASEIGLVVEDVPGMVSMLKERLTISEYLGYSATFSPVGDEHGLFIVVPQGRKWFGAEHLAASIFPADVRIKASAAGVAPLQFPSLPYSITSGN